MTVFNARTTSTATAAATTTTTMATGSSTTASPMNEGGGNGSNNSGSITRQPSNPPAGETAPNVVDNNVVFPVGSVVECRTVLDTTLVGQVVCSDQPNRLLVLKDTSGPKPLMRLINLALVAHVTCLKDKTGEQGPPWKNIQISAKHVQERMSRAEARKKASVMQADIPIEGQRVFIHLRKTLEHVEWSGSNIKVLNRVLVRPPYTADSIEHIGNISDAAVASAKEHVRKILTKHHNTQQQQTRSPCDDAPADPTPSR